MSLCELFSSWSLVLTEPSLLLYLSGFFVSCYLVPARMSSNLDHAGPKSHTICQQPPTDGNVTIITTGEREDQSKSQDEKQKENQQQSRGWRYGLIITALCFTSTLVALEGTVVSTALPSIIQDLHGGESYVWVINSFFLSR